ncbi:MAG: hypothetical protein PHG08_00575 [Bacilli bacterium]|nr:hypothetical protein [Bacilli bacterium]
MKIISNFTDYYDKVSTKNQSLIYKRETVLEENCFKKYRIPLLHSPMGFGDDYKSDLNINRFVFNKNSFNEIIITPIVVGIAGNIYFYVMYENKLLKIIKKFYNYEELKPIFKSDSIERSFKIFESGSLTPYCFTQFKCVNFVMYDTDKGLRIIKEPCLFEFNWDVFISAEHCYENIDNFLKNKSINNKNYNKNKITQYISKKLNLK